MGHDHSHSHGDGHATRRALGWALVLNSSFLVVEAGIGWYTGSLALLSDATHMVSDVSALALALGAAHLSRRSASPDRSYGWFRAETLGAFVNSIMLLVACGFIFAEAIARLLHGAPEIAPAPVLVAGVLGLVINLGSAWALMRADQDNLNARAALVHMLADALGSAGAIVAAFCLYAGFTAADPVVSLLIGGIVLAGTARLLRDAVSILLQFSPSGVSAEGVREALLEIDGMETVHELHLWTLDGQRAVLSAHIVGKPGVSAPDLRRTAEKMLAQRFRIQHTTLQTEQDGECAMVSCPFAQAHAPRADHDHDHAHSH